MEPFAMAAEPKPNTLKIVADATCTACGCACDDIELTVHKNRILQASRACQLGQDWFCGETDLPASSCTLNGKPAELEQGYQQAAEILAAGKSPIIFGLRDLACEAQRVAVGIADWMNGTIDGSTSTGETAATLAMQSVGEATCTLGEVANRGDFILFWGTDPAQSHPRHFEKYSLAPQGMFTPGGRKDRTCVVVDTKPTATTDEADLFLQIDPGKDFEALWTLRALAKEIVLDENQVLQETGVPLAAWQDLLARMKGAKYGVVFFGSGLTATSAGYAPCEALLSLVRDLNAFTRFAALPNLGRGNLVGAENVLTWRTGYPLGVNFSRGYPRYNPGEYTVVDMLTRDEVDCALVLGGDAAIAELSPPAQANLLKLPLVVLSSKKLESSTASAAVSFATATSGLHTGGTIFRQDNLPLPLRPVLASSLPSEQQVLTEIETRIQALLPKVPTA